jgi:hypothetical protein
MISVLFFIILFAIFWFLLLDPIQKQLAGNQQELSTLVQKDQENQKIISSIENLKGTKSTMESDIMEIEQSLLPYLKAEIITEHIISILRDNGMKFVTNITATQPGESVNYITRPDNTKSSISTSSLDLVINMCGTDGATDGGVPFIGYDQFIRAVKAIEKEHPQAIRIRSISMTDTFQGFQNFAIKIQVYAFNIPNPVSTYDESQKYINWYRPDAPLGGLIGTPYAMCEHLDQAQLYHPFASYTTKGNPDIDPYHTFTPVEPTPTVTPAPEESAA